MNTMNLIRQNLFMRHNKSTIGLVIVSEITRNQQNAISHLFM